MEKKLLIQVRNTKGFTQKEMADLMAMDVSNYNRREKGSVIISKDELGKLAKILDVLFGQIYEPDESHYFVFKDNSIGNYLGTNHNYAIPEYFFRDATQVHSEIRRRNRGTEKESEKPIVKRQRIMAR